VGHGHSAVTTGGIQVECSPDRVVGHTHDAGSQGRSERRNGADQRIARPTSLAGWTKPDWIICTDGKARPIESGTFPLAHGQSNRVGRLRAYGNAMHRAKITQFILASQEAIGDES
jgi:DNA (cytosine-5)-methyltransferase 1